MFLVGPAPDNIIFSTPRHIRLPEKLVTEHDCYGCALYPSVRGVVRCCYSVGDINTLVIESGH